VNADISPEEDWLPVVRALAGAPGSQTRTAADALLQTIELAQPAEDLGVDGAFVRVHHFERQLASPFPLLSAIAARTARTGWSSTEPRA
jgi:alkanesulfonate monooxygenase SsuD/methylene tetrahydromethanopterin reductase-like flavin-dependent oxidoreductase (luciferase family)